MGSADEFLGNKVERSRPEMAEWTKYIMLT